MLTELPGVSQGELERWILESIRTETHLLGRGYQGHVFLFDKTEPQLVIKTAMGTGLGALARRRMLVKEYRVYQRLAGMKGVPRCFGMINQRHLVLEFVKGTSFRQASIADRSVFFDRLAEIVRAMHARNVAHGDMKKKDNLLVLDGDNPCLIDFGVAVIRKPGLAPVNHYLFDLAARFDINACAKFRLGHTPDPSRDEENFGYRRTMIEKLAGGIKRGYLGLRSKLLNRP